MGQQYAPRGVNKVYQDETDAIIVVRQKNPNVGATKLAGQIKAGTVGDKAKTGADVRSLYSILNVIRRYDAGVKRTTLQPA